MSNYETVFTLDQIIANFRRGEYNDSYWSNASSLTYGFPSSTAAYHIPYGPKINGFSPFTQAQQEAAVRALTAWCDVANLVISPAAVGEHGNISFADTTSGPTVASTYMPGISDFHGGDIWVNPNYYTNQTLSLGSYGFKTLLHEIGHALGLPHPGDYNDESASYFSDALYQQDTRQYSVMSYFAASYTGASHDGYYSSTPLLHDIAAIQFIYGANMATRADDSVYGYHSNIADRPEFDFTVDIHPVIAIWDGGGNDTIDLSGSSSAARLDLNQGAFSDVLGLTKNLAIAYGAVIENAIGTSGSDTIIGNAIANFLIGGLGSDSLVSGEGDDILQGGPGDDYLTGGAGLDFASYADSTGGVSVDLNIDGDQDVGGGAGTDALVGIEYLIGSNFGDTLIGNAINNYLSGGAGNDVLQGGAGDDYLAGGVGLDFASYADSTGGVSVDLNIDGDQDVGGGAGIDTLVSIEYLIGSNFGDTLIGNAINNYLSGGAGNDVLQGGPGDDYLTGGVGLDFASYADASGGVNVDLNIDGDQNVGGGVGSDALVGIEYLIGSNFGDRLIGNGINNYLSGGAGNDYLLGSAGDDYLTGGTGFDVASYADASGGVSVDLNIVGDQNVGGGAGSDALVGIEYLVGSSFGDRLIGNGVNNYISGGGGNDILQGGAGDDYLTGDAGFDVASYADAGGGVSVDLNITGDQNVGGGAGSDALVGIEYLIGSNFGDTLIGNAINNYLSGGAGNDVLQAGAGDDYLVGGAGNDSLSGGTGADIFAYNAASEGGDTITDFVHGTDKIDLAAIDAGILTFQAGATTSVAAHSVNWYETGGNTIVQADVNGNATADFQITLLGTGLGLTAADFIL